MLRFLHVLFYQNHLCLLNKYQISLTFLTSMRILTDMSHEGLIWELHSYTYIAGVNHVYSYSTNFDGHFSNGNVSEPFRTKRVRNSNHNMVGVLFYSCGVYACVNYPQPVNKSHINLNAIKLTDMWQIDIMIFFDLRTLWFGSWFGLFSKNCSDGYHTLGNIWHVFEVDISTCLLIER